MLCSNLATAAGYSMYCAGNILEEEAQAFHGYGLGWNSSLFLSVFLLPGQERCSTVQCGCKRSFLKGSSPGLRVAVSLHNKSFPGSCSAVPLHWLCENNCANCGMFFLFLFYFFLRTFLSSWQSPCKHSFLMELEELRRTSVTALVFHSRIRSGRICTCL